MEARATSAGACSSLPVLANANTHRLRNEMVGGR